MPFLLRSRNKRGIGASAGEVPAGASAHLDFVNGVYYADGSHQAVSSLLGGTFDISKIEARGLYISNFDASGKHEPNAIGSLFDVLEAGLSNGCTIVSEFEPISDNLAQSTSGLQVMWTNNSDPDLATEWLWVESSSAVGMAVADGDAFSFTGADNWNSPAAQVQRCAFTVARDTGATREYALSVNGSTAATDTHATAHSFTPTRIALWAVAEWSWWPDDWCVRSFTVYPVVTPAELPALSTIA